MAHPLDLSPQALADLVHKFNNLPRQSVIPNEQGTATVSNTWTFGVFSIPMAITPPTKPESDLLLMINPGSVAHFEGPWPTLGTPRNQGQMRAKAERTVVSLLTAFVVGFEEKELRVPKVAPWAWSVADQAFARALGDALRRLGVREELCEVAVMSDGQRAALERSWGSTQNGMRAKMDEGIRARAR